MNSMSKLTKTIAATSLILSASVACKPKSSETETKSLDNFTAGPDTAFTFNSCSGSNQVQVKISQLLASGSQQTAIKEALSAVPVELQSAFFDTLKGTISVVRDIKAACPDKASVTGEDATLACWQPGEANASIYIKAEEKESETIRNIRHAVVRSMGFILTDVILKVSPSNEATLLKDNAAIQQVRKELTEALVKDIKSNKEAQLPALYNADRTEFEKAAFAESFDSWYCSKESNKKMEKLFSKTHTYFSGIAADLPAGLRGEKFEDGTEQEGMNLWGRFGGGNGPLRQGLSNWGNFRSNGGGLVNFGRFNSGGGLIFQRPWFNPARWGRG